jgi:hypothetical protein
MGFSHELVHGCKEVILEEEVRCVSCQRFACPIPVVIARFAVTHERHSECSSERKRTRASKRMKRRMTGAAETLYVLWRRGSLNSSAANEVDKCSRFERSSFRAITP